MARENVKRKPAKRLVRRRTRYVPPWEPLKTKWDALEDERLLTQKGMAGSAELTEGAVSQLLNGTTKLTVELALQFCKYMRVGPIDIWPDFPFRSLVPGNLSPDEIEFALLFRMVKDPNHKTKMAELLRSLAKAD